MEKLFGNPKRDLYHYFIFQNRIVNFNGSVIGARFSCNCNRLPRIGRDIYIDIPKQYLMAYTPTMLNFEESLEVWLKNKKEFDYEVFTNEWPNIRLVFDDDICTVQEDIFETNEFVILGRTAVETKQALETTSFILPNMIVRYVDEDFIKYGPKNLETMFDIIYGTDFIERFEISSVHNIEFFHCKSIVIKCSSRKFNYHCNDELEEEFAKMLEAFYDTFFEEIPDVELIKLVQEDDGYKIVLNTSLLDLAPEVKAKNELQPFDLYVQFPNERYYMHDINRDFITEMTGIDNPFKIKPNVLQTNKATTPIVSPALHDTLRYKGFYDCFKNFFPLYDNTFLVNISFIPHIPVDIIEAMKTDLIAIFKNERFEPYKDALLLNLWEYVVKTDEYMRTILEIRLKSKVDPNAFGEKNASFFMTETISAFNYLANTASRCTQLNDDTLVFSAEGIVKVG